MLFASTEQHIINNLGDPSFSMNTFKTQLTNFREKNPNHTGYSILRAAIKHQHAEAVKTILSTYREYYFNDFSPLSDSYTHHHPNPLQLNSVPFVMALEEKSADVLRMLIKTYKPNQYLSNAVKAQAEKLQITGDSDIGKLLGLPPSKSTVTVRAIFTP